MERAGGCSEVKWGWEEEECIPRSEGERCGVAVRGTGRERNSRTFNFVVFILFICPYRDGGKRNIIALHKTQLISNHFTHGFWIGVLTSNLDSLFLHAASANTLMWLQTNCLLSFTVKPLENYKLFLIDFFTFIVLNIRDQAKGGKKGASWETSGLK